MSEEVEYRCFIGGLAWATSDRGLRDAFEKYGHLTEAKVVLDKFSGRSRGFGFVTFDEKKAMDEAIAAMNGMDLDGRTITVDKAQPQGASGRDHDGDRSRDRDRMVGRMIGTAQRTTGMVVGIAMDLIAVGNALEDVAGMMAAVVVQEERGMAVLLTIAPEMAAFTRIYSRGQTSGRFLRSAGSLVKFQVRCSVWF
ncbi:hypothetical protein IGI04_008053 [Brassica rapa subsp. trilocularis]|uniref:RRM domain-containing protein n=1 Tax=Brassica rapa subsp. trilocularis TaxID=1813537 RepID=A0ABQ7NPS8_BRACM|nr:hypothetical protein IGI04_008053 [Brassica rapa subsp. trilocularis]